MLRKVLFSYVIFGLVLFSSWNAACAKSSLTLDSVKIGSRFMAIDGDEGRFREDNYVTDNYSGGLEELIMSGTLGDAVLSIDAHALSEGDYGLNVDLLKEGAYFFKLNSRQMRRYYDGSNEPWNPASYSLGVEFADREDGHIYADRFNADAELGFHLDNFPDVTFGYTHWARDGQETLLRGEDISQTGLNTLRAYPALVSVDGVSEKVFVQLSDQLAGKHNVSLKQEFEVYHDDQFIDTHRYSNGALSQSRLYYDEPQFQESLTHVNYNSFLTEKTYLSTNYFFQDLKNRTNRTELRPVSGGVAASGNTLNQFINPDVSNERKANILNMGLVNLDGLVKDLRLGVNARFQSSDTDNEGEGFKSGTLRKSESEQSEYQYAESLSLSYNGIRRTTLSYTLELEQRRLNWSELADIASYEMVTDYGAPTTTLDRETNIRHNDIVNTLQVSTRPDDKSRLTAKYKHADKRRKYENVRDNLPTFYPGYLGSSEQTIDQVTLGYNTTFTDRWSGGLQYVAEINELGYAAQGGTDGLSLMRSALSGSLTGILTDKLTLTLMTMGELQDLETPGEGISTNPTFYQGEKGFDYKVNRYVALAGGNYRWTAKTSTHFGLQHTEVDGTIRNSLDKLWIGANYDYNEDTSLDARLEVFNFNEKTVGYGAYNDYDDYHGVGAELSYSKKF